MANVNIPPRERQVIRAVIKALHDDPSDMYALCSSYLVRQRTNNRPGRVLQAADLLEALIQN